MPLHRENGVLNAFRNLLFSPKTSKDRDTRGDPELSRTLAERFLAKLEAAARASDPAKIAAKNWGECAPTALAEQSSPKNSRLGVLYVETENPSVKQELMFSERAILAKLRKIGGCEKIKKIRFL